MNSVCRVTSVNQWPELLGLVHDRWFSIDDVIFRKELGTLVIPLRNRKSKEAGTVHELVINGVRNYSVIDQAEVGEYDINTVKYTPPRIQVEGNIPITITAEVDRLDIEVRLGSGTS